MTTAADAAEPGESALPFDVRLVPCALAAWTVTVVGILAGSSVAAWIGVAAVAAAAVGVGCIVCAARSDMVRRALIGLVAAAVVTACCGVSIALRMAAVSANPVGAAAEKKAWISVAATVAEDPRTMRSNGPATVIVRADLDRADIADERISLGGRILVIAPADGWSTLLPGQNVEFRGRSSVPDRADMTAAVLTVRGPPLRVHDPGVVASAAGSVRAALSEAAHRAMPSDRAGLLPGLVVGDVSGLEPDVEADFRAAGLTHLTAVSGANFSILLGAVLLIVRFVGIGPRPAVLACAVVIVVFVVIARPSPSVVRAAVMGAIGLLAFVTGRRKQAVPALCAAVMVLLAWSPQLAVDFGFALSVVATAGLVLLAPVWADALQRHGWRRTPAEVVAVAAAAHAMTAPVVAAMAGTFSVVGVAANILVSPVVAPITVVGAAAAVVAPLSVTVAQWMLVLTSAPLWWLVSVAERAASAPGAAVAVPDGVAGAGAVAGATVLILVLLRWRPSRWVAIGVCGWFAAMWVWHVLV